MAKLQLMLAGSASLILVGVDGRLGDGGAQPLWETKAGTDEDDVDDERGHNFTHKRYTINVETDIVHLV
ncbi:hypothetical protein RRF57_006169 [Xylaria bambusicola]|uniref:Secreted protein n=1 Tax=Xylaria bambusicola TaxID=326684 RepID=A0AAN7UZ05_9PEZI